MYRDEIDILFKSLMSAYLKQSNVYFPFKSELGCPAIIEIFGDRKQRIELSKLYITAEGKVYGEDESLLVPEKEMDDDLNISEALATIFDFMKEMNILLSENQLTKESAEKALALMEGFDSVLGLLDRKKTSLEDEVAEKIRARQEARKNKDFKLSDKIRDDLLGRGIILEDSKQGVRWRKA